MKKMFFVGVFLVLLLVLTMAHGQVFGDVGIHRVVFPQFAYGGGWTTTIIVTNVSDNPMQFTIGFTRSDDNFALESLNQGFFQIFQNSAASSSGDVILSGMDLACTRLKSLFLTI